jgi:hypothetical protein
LEFGISGEMSWRLERREYERERETGIEETTTKPEYERSLRQEEKRLTGRVQLRETRTEGSFAFMEMGVHGGFN